MNQRQRNNNIFVGGVLIFLAVYVVLNKLVVLPNIPVFKIIVTGLLVYIIVRGFKKKEFGMIFMPGAILLCMYDRLLGIESITPWVVIFAAMLLTGGFNLIFKKGNHIKVAYNSGDQNALTSDYSFDEVNRKIVIENSLGETTRYITEENLREVVVDNGLGKCTVYFQGATMENNMLKMLVDNGLGATTVYCPKEWSINLSQDNGLGNIAVKGDPSSDPQAPCLNVHVDNGLGAVEIIFI